MENQALKWKFCLSYSHSSAAQCPILFSFSHRQPNQAHRSLFKGDMLTFQNSLCCCLGVLQTFSNAVSSIPCLWAGLEFLRKGYSSLTSRALELALGYREPKQNRRYVFTFQYLHVISRPVYVFLLDNLTPAVRFHCTRLPLKSVADHTACIE